MKLNVFSAIAYKQFKDIFKNKTILLQFLLFPLIAILMLVVVPDEEIKSSIPIMFSTIFIGMTPLSCMASIIAEEKEKNTLTALKFAFVKSVEYLLGIGSVIFLACTVIILIFSLMTNGEILVKVKFFIVLLLGLIPSMILGSVLGILSKNQMSVASIVSPISLIVSLLPLFSTFNENIRMISRFIYTQQINDLLNNINNKFEIEKVLIIMGNAFIFLILFAVVYKKKGLKV